MKVLKDIYGAIHDIPKVGFTDAMRGLFLYSTIPCWFKYQFICRRDGHANDGECMICWRMVDDICDECGLDHENDF